MSWNRRSRNKEKNSSDSPGVSERPDSDDTTNTANLSSNSGTSGRDQRSVGPAASGQHKSRSHRRRQQSHNHNHNHGQATSNSGQVNASVSDSGTSRSSTTSSTGSGHSRDHQTRHTDGPASQRHSLYRPPVLQSLPILPGSLYYHLLYSSALQHNLNVNPQLLSGYSGQSHSHLTDEGAMSPGGQYFYPPPYMEYPHHSQLMYGPQSYYGQTGRPGQYNPQRQQQSRYGRATQSESEMARSPDADTTQGMGESSKQIIRLPRGPPKKPAQSGHALWVGNLPDNTTLQELCSLFGTMEIQSIFLIEKTKCAFVNYKTSKALQDGIKVFQDRGSSLRGNNLLVKEQETASEAESDSQSEQTSIAESSEQTLKEQPKDRYFICKSLTEEDLMASVNMGIWSTQSHNQALFNKAFQQSENVYLFFSANRTRCFHGYARMESEILMDESPQESGDDNQVQLPKITVTEEDPSIPLPAGRIVDDSARRCLFWEVMDGTSSKNWTTSNNWTLPFRIKWLSPKGKTLSFDKLNHLRNPLNDDKPVKIARDGTEVFHEVGKQMIELFHKE